MHRPLQQGRSGDDQRPDYPQRDTVLAAVKAWPVSTRARRPTPATAILDGGCARRQPEWAGRDEETASRSNKETDQDESSDHRLKGLRLTKPHHPSTASGLAHRANHEADI
jgi:hypothetical protein